jgi:hypothetical protein
MDLQVLPEFTQNNFIQATMAGYLDTPNGTIGILPTAFSIIALMREVLSTL